MKFLVFVTLFCFCTAKDSQDKLSIPYYRFLVACHSTDFECFRRQYRGLRDKVLLGNQQFGVEVYHHYIFEYGQGTCIRLTGLELSELTGIEFDSVKKELTWTLELPFKIQQMYNNAVTCVKPEIEISVDNNNSLVWLHRRVGSNLYKTLLCRSERRIKYKHKKFKNVDSVKKNGGPLKKFTGNATIQVTYPFVLTRKKTGVHMSLSDENLDVILDIPDLNHYNKESQFERNLYELSEWAYSVVQHIDAAQFFALPYTTQLRNVTRLVPMGRLFLLYPEEEYSNLRFKHSKGSSKCYEKIN